MNDPCLPWPKELNSKGYGRFRRKGKWILAHRAAWEREHGPIPEGMQVAHRCNNKKCVKVEHLYLATPSENTMDAYRDGLNPCMKIGEKEAKAIRAMRWSGMPQKEIARIIGVSQQAVSLVLRNQRALSVSRRP